MPYANHHRAFRVKKGVKVHLVYHSVTAFEAVTRSFLLCRFTHYLLRHIYEQYKMVYIESHKIEWHPINNIWRKPWTRNDIYRKGYWNFGLFLLFYVNNISFVAVCFGLKNRQYNDKLKWCDLFWMAKKSPNIWPISCPTYKNAHSLTFDLEIWPLPLSYGPEI